MKLLSFTLLIILFFFAGYSQKINDADFLKKYSYPVVGAYIDSLNKKGTLYNGTGFFIKTEDGDVFFITAKHVLTGCEVNTEKNPLYPDEMEILLSNKPNERIKINTKAIRDTVICRDDTYYPDLISYRIDHPEQFQINSIEKFKSHIPTKKYEINIYGFPDVEVINWPTYIVGAVKNFKIKNYEAWEYFKVKDKTKGILHIDSINYGIKPHGILIGNILKGYSGSPVFIIDEDSGEWNFFGLFGITSSEDNLIYVIKPYFVFQSIINH